MSSSILTNTDGLVLELHPSVDAPTSLLNHANDTTTATIIGAPTWGAGYMDFSGNAGAAKGIDTGYQAMAEDLTFYALVDPNNGIGILSSSGTADAWRGIGRMIFDAPGLAGETFGINGQTVTLRNGGAAGFEINIGATRADSAASATALINAYPEVFGVTAFCPPGNSVIDLLAVDAGAIAIPLSDTSPSIRMTDGGYTLATGMTGGAAGDAVTQGLYVVGTNFQYRNSALGTGGVAAIPIPPAAGYYFIVGRGRQLDFPELLLFSGGELAARSVGTTPGRARRAPANVQAAQVGGGSGTDKGGFLGILETLVDDDRALADYLAIKPWAEARGLVVN